MKKIYMWTYTVCEKGGISLYKDEIKLLTCAPSDNIYTSLKNSIKYISELIVLNIDYTTKEEMVDFINMACKALTNLNNMLDVNI